MGGGLMPRGDSSAEKELEDHSSYGSPDGQGSRRPQFCLRSEQDTESADDAVLYPVGTTIDEGPLDHPMQINMDSSAWTEEGMDLDELGPLEDSNDMISSYHKLALDQTGAPQLPKASRGQKSGGLENIKTFGPPQREEGVVTGGVPTEKGDVSRLDRRTVSRPRTVTSRVFKLMEIRNDSQDLSVVEKMIFCEENIFSLCNTLSSNSARIPDGQRMIDFSKLDTLSNVVIGFYGSKEVMMEIFQSLGIASEDLVWRQMRSKELSPGLYVWLRGDSVFVFYWHQGDFLPDASHRGMSCNFIRYIVDLCDTVCICLEGEKLKDSFFTSVQKFSKRQRTQRLQIALVKATENSISVCPGFSLLPKSLFPGDNAREFKWTEGSHRLALLASFPRQPKIITLKHTERMKLDTFSSTVGFWKDEYSLDLSYLLDGEFITFLEVAKLDQYRDLEGLRTSHEAEKRAWSERKSGVDELKAAEEGNLKYILTSYINICLKIEFPSEHRLFSADQSSTKNLAYDEKLTSKVLQPETGVGCLIAHTLEDNRKVLRELESGIHKTIFGKDSYFRLVFPGATCYAREVKRHIMVRDESCVYTMEHDTGEASSSPSDRKYSPFRYGNRLLLKSGSKYKNGKIYSTKGISDGLIVDDDTVCIDVGSGHKLQLQFISPCSDGLEMWVRSVAQSSTIKHLYRKACFVTSVIPTLDEKSKRACKGDIAEMLLESTDVLEHLQPFLNRNSPNFVHLKSIWIGLEAGEPQQIATEGSHMSEDVRKICTELYKKHHKDVEWTILSTARQYYEPFLAAKIESQISKEYEILIATAHNKERKFLSRVRKDISRNSGHALILRVESCKVVKKEDASLRAYLYDTFVRQTPHSENSEVCVSFTQQVKEAESITWKTLELAPLKDDMDKVVNDPEYILNPSCSEGKDLIDVDPATQKLLRVYFLVGGQVLVFTEDTKGNDVHIFLGQKMGMNLSGANPIKTIKRGKELLCFDEGTRYIAFYESSIFTVKVYRFDDAFRHMDFTGISIQLSEYSVGRLIWMDFVTGKKEIAFIDEQHRLRVCEVSEPAMVRPGNLHVGASPIIKAMVSAQGSCLLVLRAAPTVADSKVNVVEKIHGDSKNTVGECNSGSGEILVPDALEQDQNLMMDVYQLDDTLAIIESVNLQLTGNPKNFQFSVVCFGSQQHLVYHSSKAPQRIMSKVLKIVSASDVCQIQQVTRSEDVKESESATNSQEQAGPILDYIPQVFDKYAASPALAGDNARKLHFLIVVRTRLSSLLLKASTVPLGERCSRFVESSIERLRKEKGKDFTELDIRTSFCEVTGTAVTAKLDSLVQEISAMKLHCGPTVRMGSWIVRLICLVPIQIARAENNSLQPLVDGLQLSTNVDFVDAISLANVIRFGLYEAVINPWVGPIKVISSMGKQSSGKSYLLNHLSGSLLDVAGGRCTDGVWMTTRHCKGCLYVLLDFEGLGSFERSEQEDMLLSIFNAAISNLTIFNKKDFHLDKETEAIFQRFQNGVNLVKADSKLFKGLFYMAIKDVDTSDVDDLKKEFFSKISQICSKSQDNFLTKMYGGSVEISAMPFFNRPEFHESIRDIGQTVEEIEASFWSGKSFLRDVKLIMSQITTKDWSPIDSKRVALRISLLRQHLESVISMGCFINDGYEPLIVFDCQTQILDRPLEFEGVEISVPDTELELTPFKTSRDIDDVLHYLTGRFKQKYPRHGVNDEQWHLSLENFISALVERRRQRVLEWLTKNTADFSNDGDSQKLKLEAVARLSQVQQKLLLCSCKCEKCFLRCVKEKGHPSNHSCRGDHRCSETCTYCGEETGGPKLSMKINLCGDVAAHDGPHACRGRNHTCGQGCIFEGASSNCNGLCCKKIGHDGEHRCNSKQHNCKQICSLPSCNNQCDCCVDGGVHDENDIHACHEKFCPEQCTMKECNRTCAAKDHFHSLQRGVSHHFCGKEHLCLEECEHQGICEVATEVTKKTKTFKGKRSTFDYELVSEQNGKRKGCCVSIPAFKERHDGLHLHSEDPNSVHFCETSCSSCGYFCTREIGHGGLHRTTHGNMRDVTFASESEEIDILDRKYSWGESGVAELCNLHCKAQGRGHIHLIRCPESTGSGGVCWKIFDGARHETCKYGPNFNTPKDELTHSAYWEHMRFEDPCSIDERKEFDLCNHRCKSDEHDASSGSVGSAATAAQHASYCTESIWHDAIVRDDPRFGMGYVTDDGHHFSCDHSRNISSNLIFIIDRSSSMAATDIQPSMAKFVKNRLGCVHEALTRFIRTRLTHIQEDVASVVLFHTYAQTVVELERLEETIVDRIIGHGAESSTTYSSGLLEAERILKRSARNVVLTSKCPTIIFLSDGGNNGGHDPVYYIRQMKAVDPRLKVHTIMFGNDQAHKILHDMAAVGDGTFEASLDEIQLSRRFEALAKSLKTKVASLM